MPARTTLWMLAFTAAFVGGATGAVALQTAQHLDGAATQGPDEGAVTTISKAADLPIGPGLPVDPQPTLDEATTVVTDGLPVTVGAGVAVNAQVGVSANQGPGPDAPTSTSTSGDASLSARVWDVVPDDPAGRSVFVGVLLGAIALAFEAFRFLFGRLGVPIGRALRAMVAIVPAFALFSRIERGSLLENPVRARVHDAIARDPGLSVSEVSSRAGIAWGTTVHHLRRLEEHGMVVSIDQPPHRRFFAANSVAASQRTAVAVILQPTARRIAELVHARPGIDQTGVCQVLDLKNPSASKHLRAFEERGLIASAREGRNRHYHPTAALGSALAIVAGSSMAVSARPRGGAQSPTLASLGELQPAMVSRPQGA